MKRSTVKRKFTTNPTSGGVAEAKIGDIVFVMETLKTCPACHTENAYEATTCAKCGVSLVALLPAPVTVQVPEQPMRQIPQEHVATVSQLGDHVLALFVVGYDKPMLIKQNERVTLGRYNPGDMNPTVDLMPYNGDILGVSRQHAAIYTTDQGYVVEDLGSTNGTWLNENKLTPHTPYPMHNGALLRLGQLGLYAYFSTAAKVNAYQAEIINLKPGLPGAARIRLTPYNLSKHISPYLTGLAGIQAVCDEINDNKPAEINISTITVSSNLMISVHLEGGKDAIRFAKGKLALWRDSYAPQVAQALEIARSLSQATNTAETTQKFREAGSDEIKQLRQTLQEAERQLGIEFLSEFAAYHPLEKRSAFLQKFMTPLHALTFSTLQVAVD